MRLWRGRTQDAQGGQSAEGRRLAEGTGPPGGAGTQEDWYWGASAGQSGGGLEEDLYWRRLSDSWYQKDLLPATYLEMHNQCYEAYNANPLANAIIELTTNFVLGSGIAVVASEPRAQAAIDRFWSDQDNHMATRVYSLCTELSLYGELFVRFFVNPYSGAVKIAQIDPSLIDQIETDPENIERALRFHQRPVGPAGALWSATAPPGGVLPATQDRAGDASGGGPGVDSAAADGYQGVWYEAGRDVVQFKINAVSNAKRGKSDLATLLPWLRRYKDWLIDRVRINKYKGAFLWDIQLNGADAKTLDRKRMQHAYPPEPGSIIVHNESEQWSAVGPRIEAGDAAADGRAIKMMIAMGAGLPEHYLAEGGDVNRATAAEMGLPTFRKFQRRQDTFGLVIRTIVDRALAEVVRAGALPAGIDRAYRVVFPELAPGDSRELAAASGTLLQSLLAAHTAGWVSRETAMRLFFEATGQEIDVAKELTRVRGEGVRSFVGRCLGGVAGGRVSGRGVGRREVAGPAVVGEVSGEREGLRGDGGDEEGEQAEAEEAGAAWAAGPGDEVGEHRGRRLLLSGIADSDHPESGDRQGQPEPLGAGTRRGRGRPCEWPATASRRA